MAEAIATREPECNEGQDQFGNFVVTADTGPTECRLYMSAKINCSKVLVEKFEARKAGEFLIGELDRQISIDSGVDFAIS